jgi:polysaccharide deacetylase 2 family uncharacterized protein YibQ
VRLYVRKELMSKKSNILPALLVLALIAAAAGYFYYKNVYMPKIKAQEESIKNIAADAKKFLIRDILIDELLMLSADDARGEYMAKLPMRFSTSDIKKLFNDFAAAHKGASSECSEINNGGANTAVVSIIFNADTICKIRLVRNTKPKIAVILDDWGYSSKDFGFLESLKYPYSVSVLPGLAYSKKAAQEAYKNKKEILLHMPMEPKKKMPLEKLTVKINMSEGEVRGIVDRLTEEIPYSTGVNNHEGSLATEDPRIMKIVLNELKARRLFFIDSLTAPKSVARKTATELGVLANARDVFIDNTKEIEYTEKQINKLKAVARKKGWAIGIGHDNPVTLRALEKNMPLFEEEGFEFVYAAELVF